MKKGLILLVMAIFASSGLYAQNSAKKSYNKWSITANFGGTQFFGDIQQYDWWPVKEFENARRIGYGLNVGYQFNSVWGVELNALKGTLAGTKRHGDFANYTNSTWNWVYFESDIFEYSFMGKMNFMNLIYSDKTKQRKFTYYLGIGMGFVDFRTEKRKLGTDEVIGTVSYENFNLDEKKRTTETVFPLALGAKFRLSRSFDLGLETSLRVVNSDKLDAQIGNTGVHDWYGYTNFNITYKIGKKEDHLEWVNPFEALNKNIEDMQANVDGLAKDSDGDGVSDLFDKEPNTPADVAVNGSGQAIDTDGDGVPDYLDEEPFTAKGAQVNENGVELDSDGDGVPNSQDLEPNTPEGKLVNFQGKTIEIEPAESTSVSSVSTLLPSIYFKVNSAKINYWSSYEALAQVAKAMKADPNLKLKVVGNCDRSGTEKYNEELGMDRAQAVIDHLVETYKIDANRFEAVTEGEEDTLAPTEDGKHMNVNRRVDFSPKN